MIVGLLSRPDVQQSSGSVEGIVIDIASGSGLKSVLVKVVRNGAPGTDAAITDSSGRFAFASLPPGRIVLEATKPGFVQPSWRVGQPARSILIASGDHVQGVRLELRRGGSISGKLGTESRPALPQAAVRAFRCVGLETCNVNSTKQVAATLTDNEGLTCSPKVDPAIM